MRVFNLIDEYTRECNCIHADRVIGAEEVLRVAIGSMVLLNTSAVTMTRVHREGNPAVA